MILVFYWVEASLRQTPWLFTDELEWSQLSRAIASTGHAARRGEPHSFESLYSFLIAPAWWIHSTVGGLRGGEVPERGRHVPHRLPAYLLARMLVARQLVDRRGVALDRDSGDGVRHLDRARAARLPLVHRGRSPRRAACSRRRASLRAVPAPSSSRCGGVWVRSEFVALPASLVLGAAIAWVIGRAEGGGGVPWRRAVLAACGLVLFAVVFDLLVVQQVQSWSFDQYFNHHTLREGSLAMGALAIGLGFLPLIGGIASLWLPERAADPAYRAFAAYLGASIVTLWVYTAAKATYLVSNLQTLIEERNLFYLSPLLLLGTALVLGARRINWLVVGAAAVLVLVVSWSGLLIVGAPYFEAPGLAILTLANRYFYWDINDFHVVAIGAVVVTVVLFALRRRRWVAAVTACSSARGS